MSYKVTNNNDAYPYHISDVHISDPFILAYPVSKKYYTYVQFADLARFPELEGTAPCFYVLESEDLINWSRPQVCFEKGDFWADKDYWAPECHIWKGKYYLFSTFRAEGTYRRCQCLVADSPKGPFKPIEKDPVTPEGWHCLDGTLYVDKKGNPWMVFCHEWVQIFDGQVAAIPLSDDLGHAIGDPIILFYASDAPWSSKTMKAAGWVTDGPFLYRQENGSLIMLWSSFSDEGGYTTGYAVSRSGEIYGPWDQQEFPLFAMDGAHAMLFKTFSGQLMMSLHCPNRHEVKRILLFEMQENRNKPGIHIVNEVTGNWYFSTAGVGGPQKMIRVKSKELPCFSQDPRAVK